MSNETSNIKIRKILMRALAGEALACTRYKIAENICRQKQMFVIAELFRFTAAQEKEHAEVFAGFLAQLGCGPVSIAGDFPAECSQEPLELLRHAAENEQHESSEVYLSFAADARGEGYAEIAQTFENIAAIEGSHGQRFAHYASLLESGRLGSSETSEKWICLNCGYIHEGTSAPENCPVCGQPQSRYIRLSESRWGLDDKC